MKKTAAFLTAAMTLTAFSSVMADRRDVRTTVVRPRQIAPVQDPAYIPPPNPAPVVFGQHDVPGGAPLAVAPYPGFAPFTTATEAYFQDGVEPQPIPVAAPVELFKCVKYKDRDEMAPCAVKKIIAVRDPCAPKPKKRRKSSCGCYDCAPSCAAPGDCTACGGCGSCCQPVPTVLICICVPKCGCEEIKMNRSGTRIRYDYGKYAVDVRIKKGRIEVDYQD